MTTAKDTSKSSYAGKYAEGNTDQFEHVFLAGLGAMSNAQKAGAKTFDSLVKQGEEFRNRASERTDSLIEEVQDAIRGMTSDAESKTTGLLNKVRDASKLDNLYSVFDARVADAMDRLNVPSKNDIDAINKKLNKIMKLLDEQKKPASAKPRPAAKRKTRKKAVAKPAKKAVVKAIEKVAEPIVEKAESKE